MSLRLQMRPWCSTRSRASSSIALFVSLTLSASALAQSQAQLDATAHAGLVGVGSCTASGCHGGGHAKSVVGSEYNVWIADDPHSRAYSVLYDEQSLNMVRRLKGLPADAPVAPYREKKCLACHSQTNEVEKLDPLRDVISDGVGCESCHGPAKSWLADHYRSSLDAASRESLGLWNTKSLTVRTQICARCHVGGQGRDVNHDLIAAGHPRLQFEMSAYLEAMPKHWDEIEDRKPWGDDFDALVWAIGQAGTSQAALRQLADRAENAATWPELAEWSCSACHHNLRDEPSAQERLSKAGGLSGRAMTWDTWNHYATRNHLGDLSSAMGLDAQAATQIETKVNTLDEAMSNLYPDRRTVAADARTAANLLGQWSAPMERARFTTPQLERFTQALVARPLRDGVHDWATAAQLYDALANVQQTRLRSMPESDPQLTAAIRQLYDGLVERQRSPKAYVYRPQQVEDQLRAIEQRLPSREVQPR